MTERPRTPKSTLLRSSLYAALGGVMLAGCATAPELTLDRNLMQALPEGAGWRWLQNLAPAEQPYQCVFEADGRTIATRYAKRFDDSMLVEDHPADRILRRNSKDRHVLEYAGLIGGAQLFLRNQDADGLPYGCQLPFVPTDRIGPETTRQMTRAVTAARNAGIRVNRSQIANCE